MTRAPFAGGEEYVTLERFESSAEEMRDQTKGRSGQQSASYALGSSGRVVETTGGATGAQREEQVRTPQGAAPASDAPNSKDVRG